MKKEENCILSPLTRQRLVTQGYIDYSDKELNDYKMGIRFAYALCGVIVLFALIFNSPVLLVISATTAFFGTFLQRHPFDYLYNGALRHLIDKPVIPRRTNQGRFACGIATLWLSATIYFFLNQNFLVEYIFGLTLLVSATLVSLTDICIPSIAYRILFKSSQN
jgi:hypothetical protein